MVGKMQFFSMGKFFSRHVTCLKHFKAGSLLIVREILCYLIYCLIVDLIQLVLLADPYQMSLTCLSITHLEERLEQKIVAYPLVLESFILC